MTKLFILHGWTYTPHETWQPLLAMLKARGVDFEFLEVPGLSDGTDPLWTLDDYVAWLRKRTDGHDKIALWGHSNGGRISMAFAAAYPEQVEKLILEDAAGVPLSGLRKLKRVVFRAVAKAGSFLTRSERARALLYKIIRESDYRRASPNMRATMANLVAFDIRTILAAITTPTLIVWGAGDTTTPLSAGKAIHAGIQNSKLLIIEDARHSPHITHPQELIDVVVPFLSS